MLNYVGLRRKGNINGTREEKKGYGGQGVFITAAQSSPAIYYRGIDEITDIHFSEL